MKKLLHLKHWQLFLLMVGVPFVFEIIGISLVITTRDPNALFTIFPLLMLVVLTTFFGWFWILGTSLHSKLPDTVKMNIARFKFFLLVPLAYMLLLTIFIGGFLGSFIGGPPRMNPGEGAIVFPLFSLIIPLHLFSMFCIFYCLYFIAKTLKAVELQRPVTGNDYIGEFFMLWFFPVGIWFLQPRINKIFDPIPDENFPEQQITVSAGK